MQIYINKESTSKCNITKSFCKTLSRVSKILVFLSIVGLFYIFYDSPNAMYIYIKAICVKPKCNAFR